MKRAIIAIAALAFSLACNYVSADEPGSGPGADVIPGEWGEDDPTLDFRFHASAPEITLDTDSETVAISCVTEGAVVRYTTDGSEPTEESTLYTEPFEAENGMVIRARAFAEGMYESEVSELTVSGFAAVETVGSHGFKVCKERGEVAVYSAKGMRLAIYTPDGRLARIAELSEGRNVIDGLDSGIYIIGGMRVKL